MKKKIKVAFAAAVLLCMIAFVLIYTRPLTIEQRYTVLDLSQCTQIHGYFYTFNRTDVEDTPFVIYPDSPHFDEMIELFQSAAFKTRLQNILPKETKAHRCREGDYKWQVMFRFEDVLFPNGEKGSGDMLHINNFFGDIELSFDGEQVNCSVNQQEQWLKDVMDIITQYPGEMVDSG